MRGIPRLDRFAEGFFSEKECGEKTNGAFHGAYVWWLCVMSRFDAQWWGTRLLVFRSSKKKIVRARGREIIECVGDESVCSYAIIHPSKSFV